MESFAAQSRLRSGQDGTGCDHFEPQLSRSGLKASSPSLIKPINSYEAYNEFQPKTDPSRTTSAKTHTSFRCALCGCESHARGHLVQTQ